MSPPTNLKPIKVYGKGGPNPPKVAMVLSELGIPHEIQEISPSEVKQPSYLAINPNGRLPAIHDPNTDLTLWESGAILDYLVERYDSASHRLSFPAGSTEAQHARQWLFFQTTGQGPYYGQAHWFERSHPEKLPSAVERYKAEIKRVTGVLEGQLEREKEKYAGREGFDGPWLVGGKMSYVDLAFVPWQVVAWKLYGGEDEFPLVKEWIGKMLAQLESFREQWRAEVRARLAGAPGSSRQSQRHQQQPQQASNIAPAAGPSRPVAGTAPAVAPRGNPPKAPQKQKEVPQDIDDDLVLVSHSFDEPLAAPAATTSSSSDTGRPQSSGKREPVTALEHFERAVEKEAAGNLGDSLRLYRQAFKMDENVDKKYRNKHFPKPPPKPAEPAPAKDAPTGASKVETAQSMKDLIKSFSTMSITPAPPEIEGTPPPPCPLASLPEEVLAHILRDVALIDVGDFMRMAQVCKRLAYLVATEDRIWRRICMGPEFGFGGMHYYWQCQVNWGSLTEGDLIREATEAEGETESGTALGPPAPVPLEADKTPASRSALAERAERLAGENAANTLAFFGSLYSRSWQRMFRLRPRVRFGGCYISTVNYMRPGQASHSVATWAAPVHIVTYYRYLRFFRDGTVLSLLTTAEPGDVVHHLTRDMLVLHKGGANPHLPSANIAKSVLRGRWRLARAADNPEASLSEVEGDLIVETEGVSNYIYRLDLALRSAGKAAQGGSGPRNNKLIWKGFYSYSPLTGEWADFSMRNAKPYYYSRVKSYGAKGE
ncbi:hypothetical protein VTJ49DRAFT_4723 [Mycothermus thermophilus]|uniref:Glutathione S-transferase n=1 Tax=Humicola insolens TaxID=85995 RepID=A0ABR3V5N5_HUMIN